MIKTFDHGSDRCMNNPTRNHFNHAVIIGGSIAGLLAARVLSEHCDRVTILERDTYPSTPQPRPGVPQSSQIHVLLAQGENLLEQLFPGLKRELIQNNAIEVNWTTDYSVLFPQGWAAKVPSEVTTQTCTRHLLETLLRQRLADYSNIHFQPNCRVTGLLANQDKKTLKGVNIQSNGTESEILAQLIVDASGRSSDAPQWLEKLGYEKPKETVINSFLGYATRWYEGKANLNSDWKVMGILPSAPDCTRGGLILPVEGDRWIVLLSGMNRDYPPTDEAEFLEFARSLRSPILYEILKEAKPLSPVYPYRATENRLRHYEKVSKRPNNFIAIGDAVCTFNPIYGQGMTVAALGALTLDSCLKQHPSKGNYSGFSQRFHQQLAKVNQSPWLMATSDDLKWPGTIGEKPSLLTKAALGYFEQIMVAVTENPQVFLRFTEVVHMLKPSTSLFEPNILIPVLSQWMQRK
ncbi:MAG: FAD-dependent oxidoreductase [Chroococcales cyanobacterium]